MNSTYYKLRIVIAMAMIFGTQMIVFAQKSDRYNKTLQLANKGNKEALVTLGGFYMYGTDGVTKDKKEAVKWFRKAANQGDEGAMYFIGKCYEKGGDGIVQDYTEAFKWYHKAALKNHIMSQRILGYYYENGLGVNQNQTEAIKWYRKTAEKDNTYMELLGDYYIKHNNKLEAFKCYKTAAEKGDKVAAYRVGECFEKGIGVTSNKEEAIKWYRTVSDVNFDAKMALLRLGANLEE